MGFFDDGGTFTDAFNGIFGTPAAAAPAPDMPIPQPPGGASGPQAGGQPQINLGPVGVVPGIAPGDATPPVDPVTGVPPASQTITGAASAAPMVGGFPAVQGQDQSQSGTPATPPTTAPAPPPVPTPQPRPPQAPAPGTPGAPAPPLPPAQNVSQPPGANAGTPGTVATNRGPVPSTGPTPPSTGRSLFMDMLNGRPVADTLKDPLWQKETMGSLAAGLKAVGQNWNKPGLAAAAGTAGAAMEGGQKAASSATEEKRKDTAQQLNEAKLNETSRRNDQLFQAAQDRLQKAQQVGTVQSRAQAWENSDLGKLQKANTEILRQQSEIRKSYQDDLRAAANNGQNGAEIRQQMQKEMDEAAQRTYKQYGIDPNNVNKIQNRGTGSDNPHKPTSWDEFNATVKPGQYYVNPSDGKVYQRKGAVPPPADQGGGIQQPNFINPNSGYIAA